LISTRNVFIISNDPELHNRLAPLLSETEYRVIYTRRTEQKLQSMIYKIKPDLIVVDPEVPTLRGLALSLLIRQWSPAPILMLSVEHTQQNEVRMLDLEADGYLSDPFNISLFPVRINNLLSPSPTG
jgi:two-component system, OmpR family, KDP operon response regulator KdpE